MRQYFRLLHCILMLALGFKKRLICYHYPCNHLICIFMRGMNYKDLVMLTLLMLLILPLSLFYRAQIKILHQKMIPLFFPLMARIPVMIFLPMVLIPMPAPIPVLLLLAPNLWCRSWGGCGAICLGQTGCSAAASPSDARVASGLACPS
jgi:hypothetical protein